MDERPRRRIRPSHLFALALLLALIAASALWMRGDRAVGMTPDGPGATRAAASSAAPSTEPASLAPVPPLGSEEPRPVATAPTEPYDLAHARVEEDRGQAMGLAARVVVPAELQHYSDRRWFLAVQMADSRQGQYALPQDDADLVAMRREGTLVEMPSLTGEYILYDVGTDASDDPMAAYDANAHKDIPLFASEAELDAERARLAALTGSARGRRARAASARGHLLSSYYDDPPWRERLLRKGADVLSLAANFDGQSYDLGDRAARGRFEARLLSHTRPAARDVILELAKEYHDRFGRLLPVTSLVRTERYQRRLSRVNANATHVEIPPHTTGCAFDISYRYMAADEQQLLLDRVARLEAEGKVEALRERRNHIHVFVFQDGRRPPDTLVAEFLDEVDASHGIVRDGSGAVRASRKDGRGARAR
jgi:hypothetical protein